MQTDLNPWKARTAVQSNTIDWGTAGTIKGLHADLHSGMIEKTRSQGFASIFFVSNIIQTLNYC